MQQHHEWLVSEEATIGNEPMSFWRSWRTEKPSRLKLVKPLKPVWAHCFQFKLSFFQLAAQSFTCQKQGLGATLRGADGQLLVQPGDDPALETRAGDTVSYSQQPRANAAGRGHRCVRPGCSGCFSALLHLMRFFLCKVKGRENKSGRRLTAPAGVHIWTEGLSGPPQLDPSPKRHHLWPPVNSW